MTDIPTVIAEADSGDPLDSLRAIVRMRAELDRAEAVAVRRARHRGASWQLIALCLGISKQAVHRKFGRS